MASTSKLASTGPLNPSAPEFVPGSLTESWASHMEHCASEDAECTEDHITPEELAELELVENWVELQSALAEEEEEMLIAVALRYAPQSKVAEIQKRCGVKPAKLRVHKGIRARSSAAKGV